MRPHRQGALVAGMRKRHRIAESKRKFSATDERTLLLDAVEQLEHITRTLVERRLAQLADSTVAQDPFPGILLLVIAQKSHPSPR